MPTTLGPIATAAATERRALLATLPNPSDTSYVVKIVTDELTFIGKRAPGEARPKDQRDLAILTVSYVPIEKILELKSFKEYVGAFANELFSYERIANTIHDELHALLFPRAMVVSIECHIRGGAKTTVTVGGGSIPR